MKIITCFSQLRHPRDPAPRHAAVGGGAGQDEGPGGRAHGASPHPASGGRAANQESYQSSVITDLPFTASVNLEMFYFIANNFLMSPFQDEELRGFLAPTGAQETLMYVRSFVRPKLVYSSQSSSF